MKKLVIVFLGLLVMVVGCSKKKSTQPEPEPDYTLQATQTIGPEGDTLATTDFLLIVPAGAFESNATLKLYASSKDKPFGNNGVTRAFRLEGLPVEYSEPLQLSIKYQGTLTNESFIAVGKEAYAISVDEVTISYKLVPATDSSGYLVGELPARTAGEVSYNADHFHARINNNQQVNIIESIFGITYQSTYHRPGGHFDIICPTDLLDHVQSLAICLDAAYDTAVAMGFSNVVTARLPPVCVCSLRKRNGASLNSFGYYDYPHQLAEPREGFLLFQQDSLVQISLLPQIRITAGREFFRFVLTLYDTSIIPFPAESIPDIWVEVPRRFWLHEAMVRWSEEKFTEDPNHIPSGFKGCENLILLGFNENMLSPPGYPLSVFGAGMSPVLKFLVNRYGQGFLVKICKEMGPGKYPLDQIINGIIDPGYEWLPGFFKDYVGGKIFGVKSDVFLDHKWGVFDIKSNSDTLKTFTGYYPELAADPFVINLDYPDIDSSAKIRLQLTSKDVSPDYMTVLVFQLSYDTLSYLGQGRDLLIEQIRELTDRGSNLLVMVVNSFSEPPYDDKEQFNIDLDVKVETVPEPSYDWNWCWIGYQVVGHMEDSDEDQYDDSTAGQGAGGSGSFSGNTFTASWDKTTSQYHSQGHLTVSINPATNTITSFSMVNTEQQLPPYVEVTYYDDLAGDNIPYESVSGGITLYEVNGTDACNHITSLVHRWDMGSEWAEIKTYDCCYDCSFPSTVNVSFKKQ